MPTASKPWTGLLCHALASLQRCEPVAGALLYRTKNCGMTPSGGTLKYTFELSWKMLKRRLELDLPDSQSVDAMSFRELMRSGGERGLLQDVDAWMVFRDKRNITSHLPQRPQSGRRGGSHSHLCAARRGAAGATASQKQ
ncbi:MAG: nucleotidyltransferase substrate binding protein [Comamonadaceae bacterium]|nr:nucleotidyltransferase substrate binding protein [Comamonadaceae bacterium]